jgi:Zn-dependent protease with chaperone function
MYFLLGISLIFACFYAVHFAASLAALGLWRVSGRATQTLRPDTRANIILVLRTAPFAIAAVFAVAFVAPAFLLFEPLVSDETVGYKLAAIAVISAIGMAAAAMRIFASWWQTRRLTREWLISASPLTVDGVNIPTFTIEHPFPVLAIVGVFRPRLFIADQVLRGLEMVELKASIAHELGHIAGRDNFKRVFLRLCGDLLVFPFARSFDRVWSEASEIAADESAARCGDANSALDLASALVKIGKMVEKGSVYRLPAGAYLPDALSEPRGNCDIVYSVASWAVIAASVSAVALLAINNDFLAFIHRSTETVLALLQ